LGFKHRTAFFFTQPMRRTENTAGATQDVILFDRPDGAGNIFESKFSDKFTRLGIGRAPLGAGGIMAEQASIGFGNCLGQSKPFAHFLKFICTTHYFSSL
jgi:hypothetical protein